MARYIKLCSMVLMGLSVLRNSEGQSGKMDVIHSWSYVDFTYPSEEARTAALEMGTYRPENIAILDSDIWIENGNSARRRVFATTPRFAPGIPATLSEVTNQRRGNATLLRPFPSWELQSTVDCQGPVSIYRIHIDTCGRLWVLDTGRIDTFVNPSRICQPKVLIYDLRNNDRLIERHEFANGVVSGTSNLATLITDIRGSNCQNTVAYIADTNAYGLVAFNLATRSSWRIDHGYFYPFPTRGTMTVAGVTFDLMDGVFGLALGPVINGDRNLYFHAMASLCEGWVPTSVLMNYKNASGSQIRTAFHMSEESRPSQSSLEVMTEDGILIFSLMTQTSLACWNSRNAFTKENIHIIYKNEETLQFVSGMKLIGDTLVVTSSRLQNYINGKLDTRDVKYRILVGSVRDLLRGSKCVGGTETGGRPARPTRPGVYNPGKGNEEVNQEPELTAEEQSISFPGQKSRG